MPASPPPVLSIDSSTVGTLPLSPSNTGSTSFSPPNYSDARNGNATPATPHKEDEDMTEDEVALMVKNALRKARKAMSSPSEEDDDSISHSMSGGLSHTPSGDYSSAAGNMKASASVNSLSINASTSNVAEGVQSPQSESIVESENEDDLARRIEEEIKGARAFAEKVYYGKADRGGGTASGPPVRQSSVGSGGTADASTASRRTKSAASLETEIASNNPRECANAGKSFPTAQRQRPPMSPSALSTPGSAKAQPGRAPVPSSLGIDNYEDEEEPAAIHKKDKKSPSARSPQHNQHQPQQQQRTTNAHNAITNRPLSPMASSAFAPTNDQTPSNVKKEPPRQHRQVVFRHPYPLPPPPILPRPDAAIIQENDVRQTALRFKIAEPDADLQALINAAVDDSLVRRSNACGALKVLASKDNNRVKMCRTRGLLEALVVASREDAVDSDALDARTRAVTTLLYLAEPKDNRLIVCRHPHMLEVLVKVIEEDTGEARLRACCALATLAKTPQNRGLICKTVTLPAVLSRLMCENAKLEKKEEQQPQPQSNPQAAQVEAQSKQIKKSDTTESRDDSGDEDDLSGSFNSEDDRMLTNTFSGTFSHGTGTFTEDQSYYDEDDVSEGEGSMSQEEDDDEENEDGYSTAGYSMDDGSIQEEEGVEMQISSLKKLNIENHSDFLARSQLSACATLTHLTKHCANAPQLAQDEEMLDNIIIIASIFDNPLHTRCIEIICNLTRFPSNNARLAAKSKVVDTLLICGKSKIPEDRLWAIRTIQNLCSDASSKVTLATGAILSMLSTSAMRKDYDEQFAAVGALMNLSTEPGSIVPLTNTKTVVATLVHLAHSPNTPAAVRKIACDSLATIGLWLQTLASAGTVPEEIPFSPLPTHSATGWLRWEG